LVLIRRVVAPLREISSSDLPTLFRCRAPLSWSGAAGILVETGSESAGESLKMLPKEILA